MTRLILALIAVCLAVGLVACGNGDGGPSIRIALEADLSRLPPDTNADEVINGIVDILERRAKAYGATAAVEVESPNRLSVSLRGVGPEEARELIGKTAHLEFHKPVLDDSSNVVCQREDGGTYTVAYAAIPFFYDRPNNVVTCPPDEEGTAGFVRWEPAMGTDSQGDERVLTGAFLRPNAEVIGPPVDLALEFTGDGSLLFQQITTELVGLPLAIFLDEQLIGAPVVQEPIIGGRCVITGLTGDDARVLAIQLNAGALPAPLRVISIEEIP